MAKVPNNVVFYDGVCNLCNSTVRFLIKHDKKSTLRFAQIGGKNYRILIEHQPVFANSDSILFYQNNRLFEKSSAVIKIVTSLNGFWTLFKVFWIIPKSIRDLAYDLIAKSRYRIFGKNEQCEIANNDDLFLFLD